MQLPYTGACVPCVRKAGSTSTVSKRVLRTFSKTSFHSHFCPKILKNLALLLCTEWMMPPFMRESGACDKKRRHPIARMASVTRQYALAGCSAVAILVVHIGLRLVVAVVFRVGTNLNSLLSVLRHVAVVGRKSLLCEFNRVSLHGVDICCGVSVGGEHIQVVAEDLLGFVVRNSHHVRNPNLLGRGVVLPAMAVRRCGRLARRTA